MNFWTLSGNLSDFEQFFLCSILKTAFYVCKGCFRSFFPENWCFFSDFEREFFWLWAKISRQGCKNWILRVQGNFWGFEQTWTCSLEIGKFRRKIVYTLRECFPFRIILRRKIIANSIEEQLTIPQVVMLAMMSSRLSQLDEIAQGVATKALGASVWVRISWLSYTPTCLKSFQIHYLWKKNIHKMSSMIYSCHI